MTLSLAAEHRQEHVTGFFSDMHFLQESGDVAGMEVWIVYGPGRYYAVVQIADGAPEIPLVVPAEVNGLSVRFHLQDNMTFSGKVTSRGLVGVLGSERIVLPRRKSYWQ